MMKLVVCILQAGGDPGPEGPALGYPWKGIVYRPLFLEYWSAGVVEY